MKPQWVVLAGLSLACGGGPKPPPDYTERTQEQELCDSLMSVWCESALDCVQSALEPEAQLTEAELEEQLSLCIDVAKGACDSVSNVGERYDECRSSVERLEVSDCEAVRTAVEAEADVPMPASCVGLFGAG